MGFEPIAPTLSLIDTVALTLTGGQIWAIWTPVLRPNCAQLFRPTFRLKGLGSTGSLDGSIDPSAAMTPSRWFASFCSLLDHRHAPFTAHPGQPRSAVATDDQRLHCAVLWNGRWTIILAGSKGLHRWPKYRRAARRLSGTMWPLSAPSGSLSGQLATRLLTSPPAIISRFDFPVFLMLLWPKSSLAPRLYRNSSSQHLAISYRRSA